MRGGRARAPLQRLGSPASAPSAVLQSVRSSRRPRSTGYTWQRGPHHLHRRVTTEREMARKLSGITGATQTSVSMTERKTSVF